MVGNQNLLEEVHEGRLPCLPAPWFKCICRFTGELKFYSKRAHHVPTLVFNLPTSQLVMWKGFYNLKKLQNIKMEGERQSRSQGCMHFLLSEFKWPWLDIHFQELRAILRKVKISGKLGGKLASKLANLKKLPNGFDFYSNGPQSVVHDLQVQHHLGTGEKCKSGGLGKA